MKKFRVIDGRDRDEERNNNEDTEWKEYPFQLGFLFLFLSFLYETDEKVVVFRPLAVSVSVSVFLSEAHTVGYPCMSKEMG